MTNLNHHLGRAHACNAFELNYKLLSAYMYDCFIFNQSSRNEILAIIDGLVQSFFSKYLITSDVADEALNLLSQTTQHLDALKAEIAWNSNFELLVKRDYIRDEMRKCPSIRSATRYHRLIIKNRKNQRNCFNSEYYFDQSQIYNYFCNLLAKTSIHISPFNSMSLGHMVMYAYALNLPDIVGNRKIIAWQLRHSSACPEFLDQLQLIFSKIDVYEDLRLITPQMSSEIMNSDHLLHYLHVLYPIATMKSNTIVSSTIRNYYSDRCHDLSRKTIFSHVRTSEYKHDQNNPDASFRNSSPSIIAKTLDKEFGQISDAIYLAYSGSSDIDAPTVQLLASSTSDERSNQLEKLFIADTLVASTSGFTLFSHFGDHKLWLYNATTFVLGYPLPDVHQITPKRIYRRENSTISPSEMAYRLLYDWNSLHEELYFRELNLEEMCFEARLFKSYIDGQYKDFVDPISCLEQIARKESHQFTCLAQSRNISLQSWLNIKSCLFNIS